VREKSSGKLTPRTPSYTDRILVRSLPDAGEHLRCGEYVSHDTLDGSDHKPMSVTMKLSVNKVCQC